jgi:hypothetical protein
MARQRHESAKSISAKNKVLVSGPFANVRICRAAFGALEIALGR